MFKQWILGITGGIAAYKTPEIVRLLKKQNAHVRVVLSQGGKAFVSPLALQAVSGNPVYSELLDCDFENAMGHIELARWAQGIIIAPLSANRLAALALGMADDLLTTICMASTAPIWVAPAMNQMMWHHPCTQQHIKTLTERGIHILGPNSGEQACGEFGLGRMQEPHEIVNALFSTQSPNLLFKGVNILITAGPTRESIDPVRYISNKSSGKMGFALAKVAAKLGANVTLISGPAELATPLGVNRINVTTAQEMLNAVLAHVPLNVIFISASAVADFRPLENYSQKIKKGSNPRWDLSLIKNPDILATVASQASRPFCVGFAAETDDIEKNAQKKRIDKKIDMIAVNDVSRDDIGFDVDDNALTIYTQDKTVQIPKSSKESVALNLLEIIHERFNAKNTT